MTADERYVWDLVAAATRLPIPALPFAAHLLGVPPLDRLPVETRASLHGLLHSRGSVERTPAVEAFLTAHVAALTGHTQMQQSLAWQTVCALRQERNGLAALRFMQFIADAGVRWHGGEPLQVQVGDPGM